jgi:1,5-anhydro-D-fructose reductase (1,5-anhydro-D-mannitol-forming)
MATSSKNPLAVRWGIIGCGDVAEKKSGPALYTVPDSQLTAVMRRDVAQAEAYARRHGAPRWYGDSAGLLADSEVNAVYIASPHNLHLQHVRETVAAGKRIILCEKPVGINAAQAQACVDACRERDVSLTVAYYRRYWPVVQALRGLIAERAIGQVIAARVLLLDHFAGDPSRPWLSTKAAAGGGALANAGSHWVDLLRYLLGEVAEVSAMLQPSALGFDVEETADVRLLIGAGVVATFLSSWRPTVPVNELELIGTEGRVLAAPLSEGRLMLQRRGREPEEQHHPHSGVAHSALVAALVPRLLAGQPSPVPGEEAVAAWRVMEAAYLSSAEGRTVRLA